MVCFHSYLGAGTSLFAGIVKDLRRSDASVTVSLDPYAEFNIEQNIIPYGKGRMAEEHNLCVYDDAGKNVIIAGDAQKDFNIFEREATVALAGLSLNKTEEFRRYFELAKEI